MLMCFDTINCVKRKHKELKIIRNLSAKRTRLTRSLDTSRYSKVSHALGQSQNFKYERDVPLKIAKVTQEKDLKDNARSASVERPK